MDTTPSLEATSTQSIARTNFIDGLRGIAAIWVALSHAYNTNVHTLRYIGVADFPVDLFIIISGFCLMIKPVQNNYRIAEGLTAFLKRKTVRLLVPYYAGLAFSLLMIWLLVGTQTGAHWDRSLPVTWRSLWYHVTLLHENKGIPTINYSYWYIAMQFKFYLLFPVFIFLFRYIGIFTTFTITTALVIWSLIMNGTGPEFRIIIFLMGMLAANIVYSSNKVSSFLFRRVPWKALCWLCVLVIIVHGMPVKEPWYRHIAITLLFTTGILSMSQSRQNILRQIFEMKPLVYLGTISYSIYLVHAPLLQAIHQYFILPFGWDPKITFFVFAFLGMPMIVLVADIFYKFFERPAVLNMSWLENLSSSFSNLLHSSLIVMTHLLNHKKKTQAESIQIH